MTSHSDAPSDLAARVRDLLRPGGLVNRRLPGYETRHAQLAMADVIAPITDEQILDLAYYIARVR